MFFDALIGVDLEAAMAADGERDNMANHSLGSAGLCVPSGLGLVLAGPASDGPMEDGIAAHARKDFVAALGFRQPPADAGSAEAQDRIGLLCANGEGVTQDQAKAVDWFLSSRSHG